MSEHIAQDISKDSTNDNQKALILQSLFNSMTNLLFYLPHELVLIMIEYSKNSAFIDSQILSSTQRLTLISYLPELYREKNWRLLWVYDMDDKSKIEDFHEKCDGKSHTVTIKQIAKRRNCIVPSELNVIPANPMNDGKAIEQNAYGIYTGAAVWSSERRYCYDLSKSAFIFSLEALSPVGFSSFKHLIKNNEKVFDMLLCM